MLPRAPSATAFTLLGLLLTGGATAGPPHRPGGGNGVTCLDGPDPVYSNVKITVAGSSAQAGAVELNAILTQPVEPAPPRRGNACYRLVANPPAVLILHGSGGIDSRGFLYAQGLQREYATLTLELFKGSVAGGSTNRPPLPYFNYSDAFGALRYLIEEVHVDPHTVGCLGFSWGGVICTQVAVEPYAREFGDARYGVGTDGSPYRFAAHAANYPVCWARNITLPLPLRGDLGLAFGRDSATLPGGAPLTGAPILIQVGSEDAYDNGALFDENGTVIGFESGAQVCNDLKGGLAPDERRLVELVIYDGATHAFDKLFDLLEVPALVKDPFARLGQFPPGSPPDVDIMPDQSRAMQSLRKVQGFFARRLRH